jgi:hypothetical protein
MLVNLRTCFQLYYLACLFMMQLARKKALLYRAQIYNLLPYLYGSQASKQASKHSVVLPDVGIAEFYLLWTHLAW